VNRWQGTYLYDAGDRVRYAGTPAATDLLYQWTLESIGGYTELRNASTGEYMHIENLLGYVQCTARTVGWMSSRWAMEATGDGYYRIRNAWQSTLYQHIENLQGQLQYGTINTSWLSAQWQLQTVVKSAEEQPAEEPMNEISYMPNPVNDVLNIYFNGNSFTNIQVYNMNGKLYYAKELNHDQSSVSIQMGKYEKSLYLIRLTDGQKSQTFRIITK
jgi:hypothetical protein